jgi:uncharacterized membrane protein (DUF373 family)
MDKSNSWRETRQAWPVLGFYERFEQIVSLVLTLLFAIVIIAALAHLVFKILLLVVLNVVDPANQAVFQTIFGMVMTVLIALEFKHSVIGVLERRNNIVQVRTVVLIALLALVRKFIIIDASHVEAMTLIGLALAALALGCVYWLIREQERR